MSSKTKSNVNTKKFEKVNSLVNSANLILNNSNENKAIKKKRGIKYKYE